MTEPLQAGTRVKLSGRAEFAAYLALLGCACSAYAYCVAIILRDRLKRLEALVP